MAERRRSDLSLPEEGGHSIDRILVALDPSVHSRAALRAAAQMAAQFDAELLALFVEDVNIRRLAELPFVQEVGGYSGRCRRVQLEELHRQLRVQVGSVRREFRTVTQHISTRCTFRSRRGRVSSEVLEAAADADVVILGKGAWGAVETGRMAPAVRRILSQAPTSTLLLQAEAEIQPPVRVVYDGTPLATKALSVGARLAEDDEVMIMVLADEPDRARELRNLAIEQLEGRELDVSFQTLTEASVSRLAHLVGRDEEGTLVLPGHVHVMRDEAVLEFLDRTVSPVLIVR